MYKNTIIQEFERSLIKKNIITTVKTLDEKNKEYNITLLVTDVKSYDVSNIMFCNAFRNTINSEMHILLYIYCC